MSKTMVVYWSGTGNTEAMANKVGEGVKEAGGEVEVVEVSTLTADKLKDFAAFALGCPSMGVEVLEEDVMEPFVAELEGMVSGKQIGLFGSYGWGDGEWMRDWEERMRNAGAVVLNDEGVIAMGEPDDDINDQLLDLGRAIASV